MLRAFLPFLLFDSWLLFCFYQFRIVVLLKCQHSFCWCW